MRYGKIWGATVPLLMTPLVEVHRLDIKPNAHCSLHRHRLKWNAFVVLSGELVVEVERTEYQLTDKTLLRAGEATTVKPGEFHRFRTGDKPCTALEIYYCEPLSADIERRDVRGTDLLEPEATSRL